MSDDPQRPPWPAEGPEAATPSNGEWDRLRRLLLGEEQGRLRRLDDEVARAKPSPENLAPVLSTALRRVSREDGAQLVDALSPTVEQAIHDSVKRDPAPLVDALFPVMGPAIRKSIAETFSSMLQSLNEALDKSLSVSGLKWRLEAWRTGKPFAEVVLLHSLEYRVEQLFLIHQKTGLLLQHAIAASSPTKDGDMVSGMFTAIQDFIQDSFSVDRGDKLQTMQVGELTVWVEQGPHALLAAVIRGHPPLQYRQALQEILEAVHRESAQELEWFDGDTAPFERVRPELEKGLQAKYREKTTGSRKGYVALGAIAVALLIGAGFLLRANLRWSDYLQRVRAEPGLVVVESGKWFGRYRVTGLRDPLAADPAVLLAAAGLKPSRVDSRWKPFQSFDDELLLKRAKEFLPPGAALSLTVKGGKAAISGVAPHAWIGGGLERLRALPGLTAVDTDALMDQEGVLAQELKKRIESAELWFQVDATDLAPGQAGKLDVLAKDIRELLAAAKELGQSARLRLLGRADSSGKDAHNLSLSQRRADVIRDALAARGVRAGALAPSGVGAANPLGRETTEEGRARNRSVVIQVEWGEAVSAEVARP